jgi:integrase
MKTAWPIRDTRNEGDITGVILHDRRRPRKDGTYPVSIRLTYPSQQRMFINTKYSMTVKEWDTWEKQRVKRTAITEKYTHVMSCVKAIKDKFSKTEMNKQLGRGKTDDVFSSFEAYIKELRKYEQINTLTGYKSCLSMIKKYTGTDKLSFSKIDEAWLNSFNEYMDKKSAATKGIYFRYLRCILKKAGRPNLFGVGRFEIMTGEGRQIALTQDEMNVLLNHTVINRSTTHRMKDMFEFSYRMNGANFKDIARLKWSDIVDNEIIFKRAKTEHSTKKERNIQVPVTLKMQRIIDEWGHEDKTYIFDVINDDMSAEEKQVAISNLIRLCNKHLNIIGKELKFPHLSTYVARHSFATIWNKNEVKLTAISEALGHTSILTTQSYINRLTKEERKELSQILE